MKRLLPLLLVVVGSMFASAAYSQVRIHANINLPLPPLPPLPHVHVYAQPAPQVVYQDNCQPAVPYYDGYGRERAVVAEPAYSYGRYYSNRDYRYNRNERYYRDDYRHHDYYREHREHERGGHRNW
ncbi:MAG TPA: hypothetical protein VKT28_11110 [Puia sp.]|nr:hypothetical protein [Puia sp.]